MMQIGVQQQKIVRTVTYSVQTLDLFYVPVQVPVRTATYPVRTRSFIWLSKFYYLSSVLFNYLYLIILLGFGFWAINICL